MSVENHTHADLADKYVALLDELAAERAHADEAVMALVEVGPTGRLALDNIIKGIVRDHAARREAEQ